MICIYTEGLRKNTKNCGQLVSEPIFEARTFELQIKSANDDGRFI
jgi:hypothetical protein